ncbi:ankyrin repeat-containing domain protein [Talaromyces proteolyticus]|uniref:Ankyrin repeat-containing domain protein n=1 Tax=Talaromyces proteolyticus TaxID=1131652 RepID=A0AAD4KMF1_9EURO|nr:ankyrin repeat-containing domain protein [Talaromyces proteolyticus]KAH8693665.1 ankyrin repeat-containing domain protein [Talaromyces proteolyticus]
MQDQDKQHSGPGRNLALYLATALGYKTLLKLLLERMDEVDEKLSVKIQATVDAAFEGKLQNQVSAAVELKIETELSVLHLATVLGNIDAAKLLIDKGADINAICQVRLEDGLQANLSPLMLAAMWKHDGMVQLLLEKGAKVSQTGQARIERTFDTAMATPHLSAMLGHEGVKRILKKADSMEARIEAELTGLHLAVLLDDVAVVSRFLEHGADPDMRCQADVELKHRDDLNANFQMQLMPLHLAAWAGHESVAALLVKSGAEVDAKIQAGGTAALEFGMRIDQKMKPGGTALHVAVGLGKEKVARVLIENGADVGAKTRDGRTAVQWAHGHDGECIRNSGIERSLESVSKDMKTGFVQKLRRVFQPKNGS